MRRKIEGEDVILLADNDDEYRSAVMNLNRDRIPYKSFLRGMIVLAYSDWLHSNLDQDA